MKMNVKGGFGIGIYNGKTPDNAAMLLRSAAINGASFFFTIGRRYERHGADTGKFYRQIPVFQFETIEDYFSHAPFAWPTVAVELSDKSTMLPGYNHLTQCVYLLGAEDTGLPQSILSRCNGTIQIPGNYCYNVAVAGSIVMYDRIAKEMRESIDG